MKRRWLLLTSLFGLMTAGNMVLAEEKLVNTLPDVLKEKTFIYDEIKSGEGITLYTLTFNESGYKLYKDNGCGIVAEGNVQVSADKSLIFSDEKMQFEGSFTGSAFQSPSVTLDYYSYRGNRRNHRDRGDCRNRRNDNYREC